MNPRKKSNSEGGRTKGGMREFWGWSKKQSALRRWGNSWKTEGGQAKNGGRAVNKTWDGKYSFTQEKLKKKKRVKKGQQLDYRQQEFVGGKTRGGNHFRMNRRDVGKKRRKNTKSAKKIEKKKVRRTRWGELSGSGPRCLYQTVKSRE